MLALLPSRDTPAMCPLAHRGSLDAVILRAEPVLSALSVPGFVTQAESLSDDAFNKQSSLENLDLNFILALEG